MDEIVVKSPLPTRRSRMVGSALRVGATVFLVLIALFSGMRLVQGTIARSRTEQHNRVLFAQWVAWRGEHCRFKGTLDKGVFVCDNGKSYAAGAGRYGEYRSVPVNFDKSHPNVR